MLSLLALGSWRRAREFAIGAALAIFPALGRPIALGTIQPLGRQIALAIIQPLGRPIKLAITQALGRPIALGTALTLGPALVSAPMTSTSAWSPVRRREVPGAPMARHQRFAGAPVRGARGPAPARRREVAMAPESTPATVGPVSQQGHGHNCSS